MRKVAVLFLIALTGLPLSGCRPESEDEPAQTGTHIIVKAPNEKVATRVGNTEETVVFTGDDILWFNGTTKEICFKDNFSNNPSNNSSLYARRTIKFYIDDEYLFSSMICVSDLSSQSHNSLVFYYSIIENKYYLTDGYPADVSVLSNPQKAQEERNENRQKIASEWNRFIEQMKKEKKYKS